MAERCVIVADENMPGIVDACEALGELRRLPGRSMNREALADADVLLVRSVTRVDAALLAGTRVRFVGSATIGTDHVDIPWLQHQGITFAHALGCNARSVAEYVVASLMALQAEGRPLPHHAAVVGYGRVGRVVSAALDALAIPVRVCDPWVVAPDRPACTLQESLAAELLCLHTPLVTGGEHPTRYLLGRAQLAQLRGSNLLLNAGRGPVVEGDALRDRLGEADAPGVVLDVWEHEPWVESDLLERVALGTPHIAGYSLEGKLQGSAMVLQALYRFLERGDVPALSLPSRPEPVDCSGIQSAREALQHCVLTTYDPRRDDRTLRDVVSAGDAGGFDRLRREYPERREFAAREVVGLAREAREIRPVLQALGFRCV